MAVAVKVPLVTALEMVVEEAAEEDVAVVLVEEGVVDAEEVVDEEKEVVEDVVVDTTLRSVQNRIRWSQRRTVEMQIVVGEGWRE
jgi:hypothetical protein